MELAVVLRQLADALEKGQAPKFDVSDPATREALESLFNTWYERAYKAVEEKLEELESSVSEHDRAIEELPGDLGDYDLGEMSGNIEELHDKIKDIDTDDVEAAVEVSRRFEDIDAKALSRIDFGELEEMVSFFRSMKAHFAPSRERDAA